MLPVSLAAIPRSSFQTGNGLCLAIRLSYHSGNGGSLFCWTQSACAVSFPRPGFGGDANWRNGWLLFSAFMTSAHSCFGNSHPGELKIWLTPRSPKQKSPEKHGGRLLSLPWKLFALILKLLLHGRSHFCCCYLRLFRLGFSFTTKASKLIQRSKSCVPS